MIDNSRGELRAHLGKVAGGLTSLQLTAPSENAAQVAAPAGTVKASFLLQRVGQHL